MNESRSPRLAGSAHVWARLALGLMVVGPSILLVYAWVEVLNNPGYTLVDGYWIGRVPWTPLGVLVSLVGGVLGLAAGSLAIAIEGGWWRRFLIIPSLTAGALWWLVALGVLPFIARFQGPDPITFAYSLPTQAILLAVMPAALLAALCLTPRLTPEARMRLGPVPRHEPWSEPPRPDLD